MCGIAGGWRIEGGPAGQARADAMERAMVHRGPDQGGRFIGDGVALVIRRLRIIDLETGDQPIASEDGKVVTVFNGEIYNHLQLRRRLEEQGHTFKSHSDTEVIVHLYEEHGDEFLHHLRGMFAIALWDRKRRRLLLARDRLGIKPLHYSRSGEGLIFASEIGSLMAAGADDAVDLEGLGAYFRLGYVPSPATCYTSVRSLPPGWRMTADDSGIRADRWWQLGRSRPVSAASLEDARSGLRHKVEDAVRARLISDVPLGAFLSGGLDSTLVVGTMARLMDRPVDTFTIGFDQPAYDETALSRLAVERFAARPHEERIAAGALDVLDEVMAGFGQPFADPSAVPTLLVSRLARRHVTVALSGDGGDELFGGYTRYRLAARQAWQDRVPRRLRGAVSKLWPDGWRGAGAARIAAFGFADRYLEHGALTTPRERRSWLQPELAACADADPFRLAEPLVQRLRSEAASVGDLLELDLHSYLPDVILAKVDRMSMACSLEARVPLLDHHLVEYVAGLPMAWRMGEPGSKGLLRETFTELYPPAILNRGKMGFGIPLGAWLAGSLRARVESLADSDSVRSGPLEAGGIRRLVAEHLSGRRDRGRKLWAILVFDAWWRRRGRVASSCGSAARPA